MIDGAGRFAGRQANSRASGRQRNPSAAGGVCSGASCHSRHTCPRAWRSGLHSRPVPAVSRDRRGPRGRSALAFCAPPRRSCPAIRSRDGWYEPCTQAAVRAGRSSASRECSCSFGPPRSSSPHASLRCSVSRAPRAAPVRPSTLRRRRLSRMGRERTSQSPSSRPRRRCNSEATFSVRTLRGAAGRSVGTALLPVCTGRTGRVILGGGAARRASRAGKPRCAARYTCAAR